MFGADMRKKTNEKFNKTWSNWFLAMKKYESDGYFRLELDLADGIYHYQYKSKFIRRWSDFLYFLVDSINLVQTKSWFEKEPEPALPNYDDDEYKHLSEISSSIFEER